jgi:hypothetical protein
MTESLPHRRLLSCVYGLESRQLAATVARMEHRLTVQWSVRDFVANKLLVLNTKISRARDVSFADMTRYPPI